MYLQGHKWQWGYCCKFSPRSHLALIAVGAADDKACKLGRWRRRLHFRPRGLEREFEAGTRQSRNQPSRRRTERWAAQMP